MKKIFLLILSALLILSITVSLFSCSKEEAPEAVSGAESELESGEFEGEEHLSPESGTVIFPDAEATESEALTEAPTEAQTTAPTESETEEITTESETETETEPPVSLKYTSYGNGTCAVSGIGNYTDVYVIIPEKSPKGDVVTAIDTKAFFENTSIKAVHIPSTVTIVGKMAFGGCSSLIYISVDPENMMLTDVNGVLYSKDKTKLYAFPAANQASEISISSSLTEIADMAFYSTPSLKQIRYSGTLEEWSKIKVGEKNYGLYSASISFAVMN